MTLTIIGGDAAGMSAASQVRRHHPELPITVFEKGPFTSYALCGLPYYVAGLVDTHERLIARTPEHFRDKMNIDLRTGHEVVSLDPEGGSVEVRDHREQRTYRHRFDDLLIATGSQPIRPNIPGIDAINVHDVNSLPSAIALKKKIADEKPHTAVIIGGGYIGIEMAEAMVLRNIAVHMIQRGSQVMSTMDPEPAALVANALRDHGVKLHLNEAVTGFEVRNGRAVRVITNQGAYDGDLFVLGMGIRPNSSLAADAGIRLGPADSIAVDTSQRTSHDHIWAAGDCAQSQHLVSHRPVHVALGTVANKQGRVAGINLAGGHAEFPGVVGTAVTKFMETEIARTGLSEKELNDMKYHFVTASVDSRTQPGYYPGSAQITLKLLAERHTARLLGVQIVGGPGSAKRIDAAVVALHAGFTVEDLLYLDFGYAPPFSGVWEPLVIAARMVLKKL